MRINGHGHILPEPSQIPKFMKDKKLFWIDDNKKFMRQNNWARPITSSSFFIMDKVKEPTFKKKLIWFDKQGFEEHNSEGRQKLILLAQAVEFMSRHIKNVDSKKAV